MLEQVAVDVGQLRQIGVERALALVFGRVERMKQFAQARPDVASVLAGPILDEILERAERLEDSGIVREQAEQQPHEELFEVVADVSRVSERVVQRTHHFGRADIHRVLIAEDALFLPNDEAEVADAVRQLSQRERDRLVGVRVEVVKLEVLEVGQEDVAGKLVVSQAVEIFQSLRLRGPEAAARRLLFDKQLALPEEIDEAALLGVGFDIMLVAGDPRAGHAKNIEKVIVERLRIAPLVAFPIPFASKDVRASADVVPIQPHENGFASESEQP